MPNNDTVTLFHIAIPDEALDDLDTRLRRNRFAIELPDDSWDNCVPVTYHRELGDYW